LCTATGSSFWILSKAAPVYDQKGALHLVLTTATDVTLQKTVEQVLRESAERYATIVEASHLGLWDLDVLRGRIVVSERMGEIFGLDSNDQMTNEHFFAALHPEDRAEQEALFRAILAGRAEPTFSTQHRIIQHNTGAVRWVKATGRAFFNEAGTLYRTVGTMADITGQQTAELQVKALQQQLQAMLENIASSVYLFDGGGKLLFVNRMGLEDMQSVLGERFRPEDDPATLLRKSRDETVSYGEDGRILPPEASAVMQALRTGQPAERVFKRVQPRTGTQQWFINKAKPLHDDAGKVHLLVSTHTDITQQQQMNEQLAEKNRQLTTLNTDLDNFIYTASHDLKSPIANLEGLLTLLDPKLKGKTDHTEQKMLLLMGQAVGRLKQTIADLAEIAKVQKQTDEPSEQVRFEEVLEHVRLELEAEMKAANVILTTRLEVETIRYPVQNLRSTLYNLISNAVKYRSPEREPRVEVRTYGQAGYTVLSVADNGLGIPARQQHKLFTLFKRLHTHVAGTGIGLYIVKRIVENYGGHIEVESRENQGVLLRFTSNRLLSAFNFLFSSNEYSYCQISQGAPGRRQSNRPFHQQPGAGE
jgi:PAS domain S-box-containing protein